jgi:hypothetical protein
MPADSRPDPALPLLLAWLLPGAGHLKLGRVWPAVFVMAAVIPLYVVGMALTGFENVSWERHPYYFWALHVWGGSLTGIAASLTRHVTILEPMRDRSVGELYTALACLFNVVAISDVWSRCGRGDPQEHGEAPESAPPAEAPAAAAAAPPQEGAGG